MSLTARFGGTVKEAIFADTCADTNLMNDSLLAKMEKFDAVSNVEYLKSPRVLYFAAALPNCQQAKIKYRRVASIDTSLHIRHGT